MSIRRRTQRAHASPQPPHKRPSGGLWFAPETIAKMNAMNEHAQKATSIAATAAAGDPPVTRKEPRP